MTADLSVEILPEFRDKLPEKGFTVGSRSAMLRFHQGYVGMLITGIYRVPGQQHYRVRVATWKDFTPFAVRSGALFMLWCGGDFGRRWFYRDPSSGRVPPYLRDISSQPSGHTASGPDASRSSTTRASSVTQ